MIAETYWQLLTDPAHWLFELTLEALTFAAGALWAWAKIKRHIHNDIARAARRIEEHLESDMDIVDRAKERHQG